MNCCHFVTGTSTPPEIISCRGLLTAGGGFEREAIAGMRKSDQETEPTAAPESKTKQSLKHLEEAVPSHSHTIHLNPLDFLVERLRRSDFYILDNVLNADPTNFWIQGFTW